MPETIGSQPTQVADAQEAWRSLSDAQGAISQSPHTLEPRIAQAKAFIELGLRTLAMHGVEQLIASQGSTPVLDELVESARSLPEDLVPVEQREQTMRANLTMLPARLHPSDSQRARWLELYGAITWLRAFDGNIVRCNLQNGRVGHLQDLRGLTAQQLSPLVAQLKSSPCRPILLEGFDPPWMFEQLLGASAIGPLPHFRQRLLVIQKDPGEFYNGLACAQLSEQLGDERVCWFIGDDASTQLHDWLSEQISVAHPLCLVTNPCVRERSTPPCEEVFHEVTNAWQALRDDLAQRVLNRPAKRTPEHWAQRYKDAGESGPSLKVAVMTSRFSTYVRHSAEDLLTELSEFGVEATLVIEPDDCSVATETFYLDAMHKTDPDLIVCINFPRSMIMNRVPSDVPFLCWVQDTMPHLLDAEQGRALSDLDFMVGMIGREYHDRYAYPEAQIRWLPMNASTRKFSNAKKRTERACDIAWVTHHGESIETLHGNLMRDFSHHIRDADTRLEGVPERIEQIVAQPTRFILSDLAALGDELAGAHEVRESDGVSEHSLIRSYISQIAERAFRIETARWAVSIAQRRGWTLCLHGNGWEANSEFSRFANPSIDHENGLADCYASAAVHLHASLTQPLHQRVAECAFSGGLTLCRVPRDAFSLLNDRAAIEADRLNLGTPLENDEFGRRVEIDQLPACQAMISHLHRLGLCSSDEYGQGTIAWPGFKIRDSIKADTELMRAHTSAFEALSSNFFANEQTLESLLEHAIENESWRTKQSEHARTTLAETMSTRAFARRALGFVSERLEALTTRDPSPTR